MTLLVAFGEATASAMVFASFSCRRLAPLFGGLLGPALRLCGRPVSGKVPPNPDKKQEPDPDKAQPTRDLETPLLGGGHLTSSDQTGLLTNVCQRLAPLGFEKIADTGSALGLSNIPTTADTVLITVEGEAVRWRDDGVDPTPSTGMLLPVTIGLPFSYSGTLSAIKFIAVTAGAIVDVSFYKLVG